MRWPQGRLRALRVGLAAKAVRGGGLDVWRRRLARDAPARARPPCGPSFRASGNVTVISASSFPARVLGRVQHRRRQRLRRWQSHREVPTAAGSNDSEARTALRVAVGGATSRRARSAKRTPCSIASRRCSTGSAWRCREQPSRPRRRGAVDGDGASQAHALRPLHAAARVTSHAGSMVMRIDAPPTGSPTSSPADSSSSSSPQRRSRPRHPSRGTAPLDLRRVARGVRPDAPRS